MRGKKVRSEKVRGVRGEKRKIPLVPPFVKGENKKGGF